MSACPFDRYKIKPKPEQIIVFSAPAWVLSSIVICIIPLQSERQQHSF